VELVRILEGDGLIMSSGERDQHFKNSIWLKLVGNSLDVGYSSLPESLRESTRGSY
jgi:hypothetical protein